MCWRTWYAPATEHCCSLLEAPKKQPKPPRAVVVQELEPEPSREPTRRRRKRRWREEPAVLAWAKAVKARDGECMECGSFDRLHAHHVDTSPSRRTDLSNGRTLCVSCHRKAHPTLPDVLFRAA